jgi:type IV secretory pathway VirB3-like protein
MSDAKNIMLPLEQITAKILLIRGEKVMLDRDLAELYGVETKTTQRSRSQKYWEVSSGFHV